MTTARRRAITALVLLAVGTGAADAFAFTELGRVFVANMGGDLVFTALASRTGPGAALLGALLALTAWCAVVAAGFRATRDRDARAVLGPAVAVQVVVAIGWALVHPPIPPAVRLVVVAATAAVMAAQTVVTARVLGDLGSSTTYITGTLTDLLRSIGEGRLGDRLPRLLVVLAVPAGVLLSTGVDALAPALQPAVTAVALVAAAVVVRAGRLR